MHVCSPAFQDCVQVRRFISVRPMVVSRYGLELALEHAPRCIPVECWWLRCPRAGCWPTFSLNNDLDFFQLCLELAFVGFNLFLYDALLGEGVLPGRFAPRSTMTMSVLRSALILSSASWKSYVRLLRDVFSSCNSTCVSSHWDRMECIASSFFSRYLSI